MDKRFSLLDPPGRPFLTAEWRQLVMLNYEIDPTILRPFVPAGVELDAFHGTTYVSIVGFLFLNTRVLGLPVPFHGNFTEINLRFYVRRPSGSNVLRGVVFIKEIVRKRAIAFVARTVYQERYVRRPMSSEVHAPTADQPGKAEFCWWEGSRRNLVSAEYSGEPKPLTTGSEEEFIAEHYWGYTRQRNGDTLEYRVDHPPWRLWNAQKYQFQCDVECSYGKEFVHALGRRPTSAFIAEGSPVVVHRGTRI